MYDVIVVGGGHAGIEAAMAAARMKKKTALVTMDLDMVGSMPCNPSVGGPAKGIVVREIDALGGLMPVAADRTALQFKMLNTTKGPGVWSLRVQSDKIAYKRFMKEALLQQENLDILEKGAARVWIENSGADFGNLYDFQFFARSYRDEERTGRAADNRLVIGESARSRDPNLPVKDRNPMPGKKRND